MATSTAHYAPPIRTAARRQRIRLRRNLCAPQIPRGGLPVTTAGLAPSAASRLDGRCGRAVIHCLYGPRPEHRARRLVVEVLSRAGVETGLPDVELAVNEMVTNARQHAPGPYELRIVFGRAFVKVAVMDSGADHAELVSKLRAAAAAGGLADGESGRGLQLVTGLFPGSWGAEPAASCTGHTPAKQVWITIARPA